MRERIIALHEAGWPNPGIARHLGISPTTVRLWVRRHREGDGLDDLPRPGRPRATDREEDARMVAFVRARPLTNAQIIRAEMGLDISRATIRRRLRDAGLQHHIPAVKEFLTLAHKRARLEFAQEFVHMSAEFLGKTIFTGKL